MKNNIEEVLGLSDISPEELKHGTFGSIFSKTYRKLLLEKSQTDGYYLLLTDYVHSPFRDSESYLRILVGVNEDDIQLLLIQYKSKFVTYKFSLGAYTFEDF